MNRFFILLLACLPSWGACNASWVNGYTFCQPITVQAAQITGTLTDFTATICFGSGLNANCLTNSKQLATVANGGNLQNGSGFDVIFTSDAAGTTLLKYSRVTQNVTTGEAELKVKDTYANGTVIYMFTGNAGVSTDQSDVANACDSFTLGRWSLPDGTTVSGAASCGSLALTDHSSSPATTFAAIGGAIRSAFLRQNSTSALQIDNTDSFTASFWYHYDNVGATMDIASNLDASAGFRGWEIEVTGPAVDGRIAFILVSTSGSQELDGISSVRLSSGGSVPVFCTITYDGSSLNTGINFYFNGVVDATPVRAGVLAATTVNTIATDIGQRPNGTLQLQSPSGGVQNVVDEIWLSKGVVRTTAWMLAEVNNESNNAAFWSLGMQVQNAPAVQRHH